MITNIKVLWFILFLIYAVTSSDAHAQTNLANGQCAKFCVFISQLVDKEYRTVGISECDTEKRQCTGQGTLQINKNEVPIDFFAEIETGRVAIRIRSETEAFGTGSTDFLSVPIGYGPLYTRDMALHRITPTDTTHKDEHDLKTSAVFRQGEYVATLRLTVLKPQT